MSAKEMFEELGFIKQDNEKLEIIRYIKTIDSTIPTEFWHIDFHKGEHIYQSYVTSSLIDRDYNLGIFFEWQKAINKQVEELGWFNE